MKNDSNCQPSQKSIKRITDRCLKDTITEEISKCYLRLVVLATPVKLSVVTALWIVSCKNINSKDNDMSNVLQIVYKFSFIVFFQLQIYYLAYILEGMKMSCGLSSRKYK